MYYSSSNKILDNGFIITHTLWIDSVTVSEFKHLHEVLYKDCINAQVLTFDKASHTSILAGARNGERTKRVPICASALKFLPTKDL